MQIEKLIERLHDAARRHRFTAKTYAKIGDYELPAFHRIATESDAPSVYISTGVHGDEPAGPMAVLDLLRNKRLPENLNLFIVPVINPFGLAQESRNNHEDIDLNRDYGKHPQSQEIAAHQVWLENRRFDLSICLHEDYESKGAYLYELKPESAPSVSRLVLDAMDPFVGIDLSEEIDGFPANAGLMSPPLSRLEAFRDHAPEAIYLYLNHSSWSITVETPSQANIVQRIDAQRAAVLQLLNSAAEGSFSSSNPAQ